MSFASASARMRFESTSTISRPTPLMTSAKADAEPTIPEPTMPTFNAMRASVTALERHRETREGDARLERLGRTREQPGVGQVHVECAALPCSRKVKVREAIADSQVGRGLPLARFHGREVHQQRAWCDEHLHAADNLDGRMHTNDAEDL